MRFPPGASPGPLAHWCGRPGQPGLADAAAQAERRRHRGGERGAGESQGERGRFHGKGRDRVQRSCRTKATLDAGSSSRTRAMTAAYTRELPRGDAGRRELLPHTRHDALTHGSSPGATPGAPPGKRRELLKPCSTEVALCSKQSGSLRWRDQGEEGEAKESMRELRKRRHPSRWGTSEEGAEQVDTLDVDQVSSRRGAGVP